jgi:hypothetical protein
MLQYWTAERWVEGCLVTIQFQLLCLNLWYNNVVFSAAFLASPASSGPKLIHSDPRLSYLCDTNTHTHTHTHTHRTPALLFSHTRFSFNPCVKKSEGTLHTCSLSLQRLFPKLRSTTLLKLLLSKPTTRTCVAPLPSWPARWRGDGYIAMFRDLLAPFPAYHYVQMVNLSVNTLSETLPH